MVEVGDLENDQRTQCKRDAHELGQRPPPMGGVSFEAESAERVRRMPRLASPTAVRTENWVLGEGESCFSQGKEETEVKEQPGHLSRSGSFLSEKKSH